MYPQVFGKYILEEELGRGGMARILLATLRGAGGFEKKLVVKQIRDELLVDGEFVRRFVEEAKTTVALSHPNIVPVYELGVEQGTYFLAMELVEGLSLDQLLRHEAQGGERNQLFPEEGAYIGVEVCRALDYAHRRMKVVHRDITPRNVMIDEEGQVKLIDFGIAAPAREIGHEVFGSPGHMPPEQTEGRELGPATDIFAVAVLLMEAWTGRAPFRRKTVEECDAAMRAKHPRPSDADPRLIPLDDAIARAMNLDPKKRQQDADELGRAFRHYLVGTDVQDIARTLGARVYHARKKIDAERGAPLSEHKRLDAGRQPSQAEIMTATFAAREEVGNWSERPPTTAEREMAGDGPDAPSDAPSTRKLPLSERPRAAAKAKAESSDDDAQAGVTGAATSDKATTEKSEKSKKGPTPREEAPPVETIATRPFETPVRPRTSIAPKAPDGSRRGMLQGAAVVAVAAAAIWFFVRPKTTETTVGTTADAGAITQNVSSASTTPANVPNTPATSGSGTATTPGAASTASTASTGGASQEHPVGTVPPQTPSTTSAAPPGSMFVSPTAKSHLAMFGTPGTRVSVDGQPSRPCAARMFVEPGSHDVRFIFDQTGESRGERLVLKPGEHVTLRADFTQATPTIQILR